MATEDGGSKALLSSVPQEGGEITDSELHLGNRMFCSRVSQTLRKSVSPAVSLLSLKKPTTYPKD